MLHALYFFNNNDNLYTTISKKAINKAVRITANLPAESRIFNYRYMLLTTVIIMDW